ncbi:MAG: tryptophan synthase subunit alpha [Spirochaetaceae bacterium]|nr:MAG: tryptophan synthase subunit alpha [Spirochaetaceae bacterium]
MSDTTRIMAHVIPWYPDRAQSMDAVRGLVDAGVSYLEVQFPFSDPTADGPAIQAACSDALEAGFTVADGFAFLDEIRSFTDIPIFLMSYASLIYRPGVQAFVARAQEHGVAGLIVPDLPPDYDEGLYTACRDAGIACVPVLVATSTDTRVDLALSTRPEYTYVALRTGTTGSRTELGALNMGFLEKLGASGTKIFAGFGIQDAEQVQALAPHCEAAVVGSAFVRTIAAASGGGVYEAVKERAESLLGRK